MRVLRRLGTICAWAVACAGLATAQLPFYTDDPAVTDKGQWHFELFNELDGLQHEQYPDVRQNTVNYKLNFGLPHRLEVDVDSPYLAIFREAVTGTSNGLGDTNLGLKWEIREEADGKRGPAVGVSFYMEFPTGDSRQGLGSGLEDYWLNGIVQKRLGKKWRLTGNAGVLFAGNTSTGALGIQSTRGQVYTGGLSAIREWNARWSWGAEVYGGFTSREELSREQVQVLAGGTYAVRKGLALAFGVLGGKYVGSPRVGGQVGFAVDFPAAWKSGEGQ